MRGYFTKSKNENTNINTVCPRSSDPFYLVSFYIKWVTTSWTYSIGSGLDYAIGCPNESIFSEAVG